jgi:hypothetical protein
MVNGERVPNPDICRPPYLFGKLQKLLLAAQRSVPKTDSRHALLPPTAISPDNKLTRWTRIFGNEGSRPWDVNGSIGSNGSVRHPLSTKADARLRQSTNVGEATLSRLTDTAARMSAMADKCSLIGCFAGQSSTLDIKPDDDL